MGAGDVPLIEFTEAEFDPTDPVPAPAFRPRRLGKEVFILMTFVSTDAL